MEESKPLTFKKETFFFLFVRAMASHARLKKGGCKWHAMHGHEWGKKYQLGIFVSVIVLVSPGLVGTAGSYQCNPTSCMPTLKNIPASLPENAKQPDGPVLLQVVGLRHGLRLRGGYQETERVLQARMAGLRAEVEAGWYNATASNVFPWDGWESHRRDAMERAPHVGFMAGTGRWLGPSIEQDNHAQQIDAEVSNLNLDDPAAERTRRFLEQHARVASAIKSTTGTPMLLTQSCIECVAEVAACIPH